MLQGAAVFYAFIRDTIIFIRAVLAIHLITPLHHSENYYKQIGYYCAKDNFYGVFISEPDAFGIFYRPVSDFVVPPVNPLGRLL